ncbi:SdrD B-like domain-containing protein [Leifsonia sp. NPDC058194]|uniref:DUF7507 domain-containing protein n=1 Tax=Leifsonia sp. NPDC058194 TaxID=3346374 RepID=UPI0036DB2DF4
MRAVAPLVGRSGWRRVLALLMVVLVGSVALAATPAAAGGEPRAAAGDFSSIEVAVLYDGQTFGPLDDGPSNGVVATNDVVGFAWKATATDLSGGVLEQTLPEGWTWDPQSLVPANSSTDLFRVTGTISDDGRTLTVLVETFAEGNPARFELGALRAIPSSEVPNGSVYTAELVAHDAAGTTTATAPAITVVSEPRSELWKSYVATGATSTSHDFGDGAGPVPARYIDYRLSIKDPEGQFAIGSSVAPFRQPAVLSDTFAVTGANPGAEFQAEVTATSVAGATAGVAQTGRAVTFTLDGFGPVSSAWVDVRMWVRFSDLPASGGAVTVTNTVAPATEWVTADGVPINLDTTNTTVARTIARPAETSAGAASKAIHLFTDQGSTGSVTGDPAQLSAQFSSALSGSALDREIAPGSLVVSRLGVKAGTVGSLSSGLTNLVAYDFWDPAEQQIVDGAALFVGQNLATVPISSSRYSVQYTASGDAADPESSTWFDTIEAAGGVSAVSAIRVAYTGGVWKKDADPLYAWFVVGVPFRLVGAVGTQVADTAVYRYDEKPSGLSADSYIVVGSYRLSTTVTSSASSIMSGGSIDYAVTPVATAPPGAEYVATMQGLGVDVALPPGLRSVEVDDVPAGWTVVTEGDAASGMTLRYTYTGEWDTTHALPTFTYHVGTDVLAPTSRAFVTSAIVHATGNVQTDASRTGVNTVSVQQVAAVSEQKLVVGDSTLQPGDTASWEARWYNTTSSSVGRSHFVDVLPFDGDRRGSSFNGSLVVTAAEIVGGTPDGMRLQYTTAPGAEVAAAGDSADGVDWLDTDGTDLGAIAGVTALRVVVDDFAATDAGYLALRVAARIDGAKDGDRFVNTVDTWLGVGGHLGESNRAPVEVVAASIGGTVWVESDDPRLLTEQRPAPGATVHLLDGTGETIASTQTDADGHYLFDGLRGDEYRTAVDPTTLDAAASEHIVNVLDRDGDLNSDSGPIVLGVGETIDDVDFGYRFDAVAIGLVKTGRVDDGAGVGDSVDWAFTITNTGAADLDDVSLTDHLDGVQDLSIDWGDYAPGALPAGASVTGTATSPLTAADIAAATVTNTATVGGVGPDGILTSADAEATVEWTPAAPAVPDPEPGDAAVATPDDGDGSAPHPGHASTPGGLAVTGAGPNAGGTLALAALGAMLVGAIAVVAAAARRRAAARR